MFYVREHLKGLPDVSLKTGGRGGLRGVTLPPAVHNLIFLWKVQLVFHNHRSGCHPEQPYCGEFHHTLSSGAQ